MTSDIPPSSENTSQLQQAKLDWRNENTPVSTDYGDVYFSITDGAAESNYVFVQQNQLAQRFAELYQNQTKEHFIIAETGFGTGLNFLQAAKLWQETRQQQNLEEQAHKHLFFISTEIHPLSKEDLQLSLNCWPDLHSLSDELINLYPHAIAGMHTLTFAHGITLILCQQDVISGLENINEHDFPALKNKHGRLVDAWFLDGFAPSKNPDMWSDELFSSMAKLSHLGTTLATFTAAGLVRRGLKAVGFDIKKIKGFGKKREMLIGHYQGIPWQDSAIKNSLARHDFSPFWPIQRRMRGLLA